MCTPQNKEALTGQNTTGHTGGSCSSHKSPPPPLWLHLLSGICIDTRLLGSPGTEEASRGAFYPCFHLKASWFSNLFFSFEAMSPTIAQLPLNLRQSFCLSLSSSGTADVSPQTQVGFLTLKQICNLSQLLESKKPQEGRMGRKLRIPTPSRTSHSLTGKSFFHFFEHYVINTWVANAPQTVMRISGGERSWCAHL